MNLYSVEGQMYNMKTTRYILAEGRLDAVKKFCEIVEDDVQKHITVEYICRREDMIPTVEPKEEFKT